MGLVNCDEEKELAGKFGVKGFPTVKVFIPGKRSPEDYRGARTARAVTKEMLNRLKRLPDPVRAILSEDYPLEAAETPMVMLLTKREATPELFKSVALEFDGVVDFAFKTVADDDEEIVKEKYSVESLPAIMLLGFEGESPMAVYEGELKRTSIYRYIKRLLGDVTVTESEPEAEEEETPPAPPPPRDPPKRKVISPTELTTTEQLRKACKSLCIVALTGTLKHRQLYERLTEEISLVYPKWGYLAFDVTGEIEPETFLSFFGTTADEIVESPELTMVALRLKRGKFAMQGVIDQEISYNIFFERVAFGNIKYEKLENSDVVLRPEDAVPVEEDEL